MAKSVMKVVGLKKAIKDLNKFEKKKINLLKAVVIRSSSEIKRDAKRRAPVDTGELRKKITRKLTVRKSSIMSKIMSNAPYSLFVELGTRPHFTKISNLAPWAGRKGIPAGAVQHSIAKKGTPAQPFMNPAAQKEKPKFLRNVRRVLKVK